MGTLMKEATQMPSSLTPENLWNKLISMFDPEFSSMTRPDLDMLRNAYWKNQQGAKNQIVRRSFENALKSWTKDQMREFLTMWLFEQSQLVGVESASLDALRHLLEEAYKHIFE